jgi:DJ-1/PfpI family
MSASIDAYRKKRVAIVASNPATSKQTGWPIGFWWAEVTHPFWELAQQGYEVEIFSPDGGKLEGDKWSDPRDDSKYSAEDLISLGFVSSPDHRKLIDDSKLLRDLKFEDFDAVLFVGGQGPMYTFWGDSRVHELAAKFYEAGRITAVICHATCIYVDRFCQFRRAVRRRIRGPENSAVLDRRGGPRASEHELHREQPL